MFILALKQSLLTASTLIPGNAAAPVNISAPVISGSGLIGQVLTSTTGTWSGSPSPTFTYQWRRGGTNIAGATSSTYTPVFPADNGASITCLVTATNTSGSASTSSNTIAVETWVAPVNTVASTITRPSGTLTISASVGTWTGNPAPTYAYQWRRNGVNISGATGATYTATLPTDSGASISCVVTATNGVGSSTSTSGDNILPALSVMTNTAIPVVTHTSGTSNLSVTNGSWSEPPIALSGPALSFTKAAYICGANVGLVTGQTYDFTINFTKTGGAANATIRASTNSTPDAEGDPRVAFSGDRGNGSRTFTGTITAVGPALVIGAHDNFMTGTIDSVTITRTSAPTFTYQWRRNGVDVSGATSAAYTIPDNDLGTLWSCLVSANNGHSTGTATAASIFVGPLDRIPATPAAVFSLRRTRSAYAGPLIRLRRTVDSAEADIGTLSTGELDSGAALAHVYSGTTTFLGDSTGYGTAGTTAAANTPTTGRLRITEDTSNGVHRVQKSASGTLSAGVAHRMAVVVQRTAGSPRDVGLELFAGNISVLVAFRLDAGTIQILSSSGTSALTASVRALGTSGWLCELIVTPSAAVASPLALVSLLPAAGSGDNRVYVGDGTSALTITAPAIYAAPATELNGVVVTAYGQMGVISATQTTTANAPVLIDAGVLLTEGGNPTIRFSGAHDLVAASGVSATALSAVCTFDGAYAGPNAVVSAGGADQVALYRLGETTVRAGPASTTGGMADYTGVVTANNPRTYWAAGPAFGVYVDENNAAATKVSDTSLGSYSNVLCFGSRRVGGASPLYFNGRLREAILFTADIPLADRMRLVRNQGAYYGITVA